MSIPAGPPAMRALATQLELPNSNDEYGTFPKNGYPTHLELPHTDDKPVENDYQPLQSEILRQSLVPHLRQLHADGRFYLGVDNGIYFRFTDPVEKGCRAPDFFYVPDVPRRLNGQRRLSYVMWVEKVTPVLVVEYVSGNGKEERDATPLKGKFWIYENAIRAPYYAIWDWRKELLEVFVLGDAGYQRMTANEQGRFPIPPMEIELGVWKGPYFKEEEFWLRVWDEAGVMLPTLEERVEDETSRADTEFKRANAERRRTLTEKQRAETESQRAESEKQRAESEKQRAESEKQRADKLAAKLHELGVDPNRV